MAVFAAVAAALLLVSPPELPQVQADLTGAAKNAAFLELNRDHYGDFADPKGTCGDEFGRQPGGALYDGWHFVTRSGTDVVTLQVAFTSDNGRTHQTYRIVSNGTSVTSSPGPGGYIAFSKDYAHVVVLTPQPGSFRILTEQETDALPGNAEYAKPIYSKTALGTDQDTIGEFNLSHSCGAQPLTPPHSDCQYPDDDSLLRASFSGSTLNGTLTCNGVPQPGQEVTATNGRTTLKTVTGSGGAFSLTGLPAGTTIVSFPGSTTVPAAPSLEVTS